MARMRIGQAAWAMGGRVHVGDRKQEIDGAVIDSRAVRGGELFFALPGSRTDGHDFVAEAIRQGAVGAVISDLLWELPESGALIVVDDVLAALQALARAVRKRLPKRLIGITGSAGKTTTKELLAALLATRFRVAHTPGNLNNQIGFPLSLLNVPEKTQWMVAELGMSSAGELRELSLLARPDVAVFTVVRPVHLEFFDSVQAIAEAKAELLAGLAPGGLIVGNADDPEVARIVRRDAPPGSRTVWYGIRESADVRARDLTPAPAGAVGSRFVLEAGGESVPVALPLHGLYNVENALAAAACAWALGLTLPAIAAAFERVKPASGRGVVHHLAAGVTVIDDSYNSNPDAAAKALAGAAALPAARRVAVLGEMLELGPEGPRFHREVGATAAELGFGPVVGVGELARELVAGARSGGSEALWFAESAAAAAWAAGALQPGDVALIKGSRGVRLERVVQALLAADAKGAA